MRVNGILLVSAALFFSNHNATKPDLYKEFIDDHGKKLGKIWFKSLFSFTGPQVLSRNLEK